MGKHTVGTLTGHCLETDREISIYYTVRRELETNTVLRTGQGDGGKKNMVS